MTLQHLWTHGEPALQEILSDDVMRAVMQRDGVSPRQLDDLIHSVRRRLQRRLLHEPGLPAPANDPGERSPR